MMEYFRNGESENLSIQEMIECDIKGGFADTITGESLQGSNLEASLTNLAAVSLPALDYTNLQNLDIKMEPELSDAGKGLSEMAWLQNTNTTGLQDLGMVSGQPENTDPTLMVNPQTGLPINHHENPPQNNQSLNSLLANGQIFNVSIPTSAQQQQQQNYVQPMSPMQQTLPQNLHSPATSFHQGTLTTQQLLTSRSPLKVSNHVDERQKVFPKPVYSYSCLIAMALKNSDTGCLPVSEIYGFMTENFPYFKTAPDGWKNSVRHNLSLNKCFAKIENPKNNGNTRKGCLWAMNPAKIEKMDEEITKWRKKDPIAIKKSMSKPEVLEMLEKGLVGLKGSAKRNPVNNNVTTSNANNSTTSQLLNSIQVTSSGTPVQQINGHVNVVELKQVKTSAETMENLTSEDLNILDNNLTLDPALNDLALQNGLLDGLSNDALNLDEIDIPTSIFGNGPSITVSNGNIKVSSPTAELLRQENPKLQGNYIFTNYSGLTAAPSTTESPVKTNGVSIPRTVSALT